MKTRAKVCTAGWLVERPWPAKRTMGQEQSAAAGWNEHEEEGKPQRQFRRRPVRGDDVQPPAAGPMYSPEAMHRLSTPKVWSRLAPPEVIADRVGSSPSEDGSVSSQNPVPRIAVDSPWDPQVWPAPLPQATRISSAAVGPCTDPTNVPMRLERLATPKHVSCRSLASEPSFGESRRFSVSTSLHEPVPWASSEVDPQLASVPCTRPEDRHGSSKQRLEYLATPRPGPPPPASPPLTFSPAEYSRERLETLAKPRMVGSYLGSRGSAAGCDQLASGSPSVSGRPSSTRRSIGASAQASEHVDVLSARAKAQAAARETAAHAAAQAAEHKRPTLRGIPYSSTSHLPPFPPDFDRAASSLDSSSCSSRLATAAAAAAGPPLGKTSTSPRRSTPGPPPVTPTKSWRHRVRLGGSAGHAPAAGVRLSAAARSPGCGVNASCSRPPCAPVELEQWRWASRQSTPVTAMTTTQLEAVLRHRNAQLPPGRQPDMLYRRVAARLHLHSVPTAELDALMSARTHCGPRRRQWSESVEAPDGEGGGGGGRGRDEGGREEGGGAVGPAKARVVSWDGSPLATSSLPGSPLAMSSLSASPLTPGSHETGVSPVGGQNGQQVTPPPMVAGRGSEDQDWGLPTPRLVDASNGGSSAHRSGGAHGVQLGQPAEAAGAAVAGSIEAWGSTAGSLLASGSTEQAELLTVISRTLSKVVGVASPAATAAAAAAVDHPSPCVRTDPSSPLQQPLGGDGAMTAVHAGGSPNGAPRLSPPSASTPSSASVALRLTRAIDGLLDKALEDRTLESEAAIVHLAEQLEAWQQPPPMAQPPPPTPWQQAGATGRAIEAAAPPPVPPVRKRRAWAKPQASSARPPSSPTSSAPPTSSPPTSSPPTSPLWPPTSSPLRPTTSPPRPTNYPPTTTEAGEVGDACGMMRLPAAWCHQSSMGMESSLPGEDDFHEYRLAADASSCVARSDGPLSTHSTNGVQPNLHAVLEGSLDGHRGRPVRSSRRRRRHEALPALLIPLVVIVCSAFAAWLLSAGTLEGTSSRGMGSQVGVRASGSIGGDVGAAVAARDAGGHFVRGIVGFVRALLGHFGGRNGGGQLLGQRDGGAARVVVR